MKIIIGQHETEWGTKKTNKIKGWEKGTAWFLKARKRIEKE